VLELSELLDDVEDSELVELVLRLDVEETLLLDNVLVLLEDAELVLLELLEDTLLVLLDVLSVLVELVLKELELDELEPDLLLLLLMLLTLDELLELTLLVLDDDELGLLELLLRELMLVLDDDTELVLLVDSELLLLVDSVLDDRLELLLLPTLLLELSELWEDRELVELSELLELVDRLLVLELPDWLLSSVSCRPHTKMVYVTSPLNADSRTMQDPALTGKASPAGLSRTKHVCPVAPPLPLDSVGTQASLLAGSVPFTSNLPVPPVCRMASVVISTMLSGWPRASQPSPAPMSMPVKSSRSRSSLVALASARFLLTHWRLNWSSPAPSSRCWTEKMDEKTDSASCPSSRVLTMDPVMYRRIEPEAERVPMAVSLCERPVQAKVQ
jgi:hypothetical protein